MRSSFAAVIVAGTFLGSAVVVLAEPPASSTPQGTQAAAATDPQSPGDKVICVSSPPPTGSHLPGEKECHSVSEWKTLHTETANAVHNLLERADRVSNGPQGSGR